MASHKLWALDKLLTAYEQHQLRTRGLRPGTLKSYQRVTHQFLRAILGEDPIDVARLSPASIIAYIRSLQSRLQPSTLGTVGASLRSFLRYLCVVGLCDARLDEAVPSVASWKLTGIPRGLSDGEYKRLIASLDAPTLCSHRDRAIVLCLAFLGLRPGEIAELRLGDIDWRIGTLHLRTRKTRRGSLLPLPRQPGAAIIDYLREERPETDARQVFLRHRGNRKGEPIIPSIVTNVVNRALKRAEIYAHIAGAYVLRHTFATRMVQHGASLKEVADFLGHLELNTTTIYAKVDLAALRDVTLPWPKVTS